MPTGEVLQAISAGLAVVCILLIYIQRRSQARARVRVRSMMAELEEGRASYRALKFRADSQRVVMEASARFVRTQRADLDRCLQTTLHELGQFLSVKRVQIYRFDPRGDGEITHRWYEGGQNKGADAENLLPTPQIEAVVREGRPVRVDSADDLPGDAKALRAYMHRRSTRALLAAPLVGKGGGTTLGFLLLESTRTARAWTEEEVNFVVALAELLALELTFRETETLANARREQLDAVMNVAPIAMIVLDANGGVLFADGSALADSGLSAEEAIGRSAFEFAASSPAATEILRRALAGEEFAEELRIGGRVLEVRCRTIAAGEAMSEGVLVLATDDTARVHAEEEVIRGRLHDAVTGLPNRAFLLEQLREVRLQSTPATLILAGLDRWGQLQDALGLDASIRYMRGAGEKLREAFPEGAFIARVEPDVFAVLLTGDEPTDATTERLQQLFVAGIEVDERAQASGASIGSSTGSEGADDPGEWLRRSHTAMLAARQRGGGCAERWVAAMHSRARATWKLEEELADAIRLDTIEAWMQPIVDLETGNPIGFEALARWPHPREGMMPPGRFIPLAEENGMIEGIGWNMLGKACAELRAAVASDSAFKDLYVSVNVSSRQFTDASFLKKVDQILASHGLLPANLQLEITESDAVGPNEDIIPLLDSVRATGIRISLDDFGTGYSSLSYLNRLPADSMKVDRSFVVHMGRAASGRKVITSILLLAQGLSLTAIAEGIETEEQRQQLLALGCQFGQGFLFAKALAPGEAGAWLRSDQRAGAGSSSQ